MALKLWKGRSVFQPSKRKKKNIMYPAHTFQNGIERNCVDQRLCTGWDVLMYEFVDFQMVKCLVLTLLLLHICPLVSIKKISSWANNFNIKIKLANNLHFMFPILNGQVSFGNWKTHPSKPPLPLATMFLHLRCICAGLAGQVCAFLGPRGLMHS